MAACSRPLAVGFNSAITLQISVLPQSQLYGPSLPVCELLDCFVDGSEDKRPCAFRSCSQRLREAKRCPFTCSSIVKHENRSGFVLSNEPELNRKSTGQ